MSYVALYRKFRPATFEDVKGQDAIVTTLKNQIKSERIGHAYLFCGTRGTGKTTVAKILAKAANCENPKDGEPCGECPMCRAIASGSAVNVVEMDAASNNSVDDIRQIVDEVTYAPSEGKYKVYIIDEVHMLSTAAFNAILKTLEEPPAYVIFILATTESHKIPITIMSRCQRYDFKRISLQTIMDRMKELLAVEGTVVEEEALRFIAKEADGSMRDALSLLDRCIAFHYGEELTYEKTLDVLGAVDDEIFEKLISAIASRDVHTAENLIRDVVTQGRDLSQFVGDCMWYLRNALLVKTTPETTAEELEITTEHLERLKNLALKMDLPEIMRYIRILSDLGANMKYSDQKRILLEVAIIRMCKPQMETDHDSLAERIRDLEKGYTTAQVIPLSAGVPVNMNFSQPVSKPKPKREKALPDDVKKVVATWDAIRETIESPLQNFLENCKLSINDDDVLLIVPTEPLSAKYLQKEGMLDKVREAISESVEKEIPVEIRVLGKEEEFGDHFVDIKRMFGDLVIKDDTI